MKVIFLGLPEDETRDMIDIIDIRNHEGEVCEATLSLFAITSDPEDDYYNLTFADGFKMYDVSGYYLKEIK